MRVYALFVDFLSVYRDGGMTLKASNNEMQTEFRLFSDTWTFFKNHFFTEDREGYWDDVLLSMNSIMLRYEGSPLCRALVMAVFEELERKAGGS